MLFIYKKRFLSFMAGSYRLESYTSWDDEFTAVVTVIVIRQELFSSAVAIEKLWKKRSRRCHTVSGYKIKWRFHSWNLLRRWLFMRCLL